MYKENPDVSHPPPPSTIRWLAGLLGGITLVILAGWALWLGGWVMAHRAGTSGFYGLIPAALLSLVLFLLLERDYWLSHLMGLRVPAGGSVVKSAALFWLFGLGWLFVKTSIIDPDRPEAEGNGQKAKTPPGPRDPAREAVETIVFVVVLVLLLKLFVTEAFVIPTGSMAETLLGYHQTITCKQCGHEFPVNSHDEVEPNNSTRTYNKLVEYCCPNCRYRGQIEALNPRPKNESGDRVLVLKPAYNIGPPRRGDVVVFKFPERPQDNFTAQNYIKRAMGFGGETLGIYHGELFTTTALEYPPDAVNEQGHPLYPRPANDNDLWRGDPNKDRQGHELPLDKRGTGEDYRYVNNARAAKLFESCRQEGFTGKVQGGFGIVRKVDEHMLACMRVVWDNDHQPAELAGRIRPRWHDPLDPAHKAFVRWTTNDDRQPKVFTHIGPELDWIRYHHLVRTEARDADGRPVIDPATNRPQLREWTWDGDVSTPVPGPVDNFLGYNAGVDLIPDPDRYRNANSRTVPRATPNEDRWVGDLILECEANIPDGGEVVLELSKGICRFRATFAGGQVSLSRVIKPTREATEQVEEITPPRPCGISGPGTYKLRFANVDCRLRVWVNGRAVPFGTDGDYAPGLTATPDNPDGEGWTEWNDVDMPASIAAKGAVTVQHLQLYRDIYYTNQTNSQVDLYYVHPGHYFCLGDNSSSSADSRTWGLVPERLMLGKAVFVFFPMGRVGFIK